MIEDAVEPQTDNMDAAIEQHIDVQEPSNDNEDSPHEKVMVPLHVVQKLRQKNKEMELELQWEKQRNTQSTPVPQEDDSSRYESATREDVNRSQKATMRMIEERMWIRSNPEKYEEINQSLKTFLKQRPHLARAIEDSPNRYEEAYTLMKALSPKQQQQLRKDVTQTVKKEAPNAPGGVPKAAALNEVADVMSMTDSEFAAWRQSKKRRR